MTYVYILVRSVTYARAVEKLLLGKGFDARQVKSPRVLGKGGCGYAVAVKRSDPGEIVGHIAASGLPNFKIYTTADGKSFESLG